MSGDEKSWGLAALGTHRSITVELCEPIGREGPWHLQLEGTRWNFRVDVAGKEAAIALCTFVKSHAGRAGFAEHHVGLSDTAQVCVVKDDEGDRFFIRVSSVGLNARVAIQDEEALDFQKALEDLIADLTP